MTYIIIDYVPFLSINIVLFYFFVYCSGSANIKQHRLPLPPMLFLYNTLAK